jgi:hypothetical protein
MKKMEVEIGLNIACKRSVMLCPIVGWKILGTLGIFLLRREVVSKNDLTELCQMRSVNCYILVQYSKISTLVSRITGLF